MRAQQVSRADYAGQAISRFSCGRTNRRTTKRHRDCSAHHIEQYPNPSGVIKPLERAHEINKRPIKDSHGLPGRQVTTEERQIGFVSVLDESFDDAFRYRDRTILAGE